METTVLTTEFTKDVLEGLSATPKYLSSKYFYDERGSKIFEAIMRMPEYYLTDCEIEVFNTHKAAIFEAAGIAHRPFELVELGAGDGLKTKILLQHLLKQQTAFTYMPIDISVGALEKLETELRRQFPELKVKSLAGDYFKLLGKINGRLPKMALFLGSNIGNFEHKQSLHFLKQIHEVLNPGDFLLIGFDLKKPKDIILKAYSDPHGHTAAFNLNLLQRMNRELGANFNPGQFFHQEIYEEESGLAKSFLVSKKPQKVFIRKFNQTFAFAEGEKIFTEQSQKYDEAMIAQLAQASGFAPVANFYDSRHWYVNALWKATEKPGHSQ